ncbi:AMIN-like domain-containing (lipo)protein [Nocardioides sp.]|uniref:AMIN-like domain-containing (lipo)protein n=1 Tax=Nocardioides sp. TaxID=35761 RepID=UPI002ED2C360
MLVDVEVAEAEGFDRIVLEFSGRGTPGWVVNYVDEAVLDGSGEVVSLGGAAVLDIYASGTTWPAPNYYRGPSQFTPVNGGDVTDVYVGGTFEGYTQVLAGIDDEPVPFRVYALTAPSRLVIDVARRNAD